MANTYIIRAEVDMNGQPVTDFKSFTETAHVLSKAVHLMHKTGNAAMTRRFAFTLDYVLPTTNPIDWESFVGTGSTGTASIVYDGGLEKDFGGVSVIEVGEATTDGENETVQKISFMAESKNGAVE